MKKHVVFYCKKTLKITKNDGKIKQKWSKIIFLKIVKKWVGYNKLRNFIYTIIGTI